MMVTKVKTITNRTIQICTFMLLMIVSYMCIYSIPTSIDYDRRREYYLAVLVALIFCLILMVLCKKLIDIKVYDKRNSFVVLFLIIATIQIMLFIAIKPLPVWDSMSTIEEAIRMSQNGFEMSSQNGYFARYGNNYPFTILMASIYKLLNIFHINNYWFVSVLLNIISIDFTYGIATYLICKVYGRQKAFLFAFVSAVNPFVYIFCWYVYTGTFGGFFMMLSILYIYKIYIDIKSGDKKYKHPVMFGVVFIVGTLIRVTTCFPIIAIVVYLALSKVNSYKFLACRNMAIYCIIIFVVSGIIFGSYKLIENRCVDDSISDQNFPITHWIAMGLNIETNGSFSDEDEKYTESFDGKAAKQNASSNLIKHRVLEMADSDFISIYKRKLAYTWSKPALAMDGYLQSNQNSSGMYKYIAGGKSAPFAAYCQIFMATLYLCAGITALKLFRAKNIQAFLHFVLIIIFGAMVFHLIWESSKVYCIGFIPLISMLAVCNKNTELGKLELAGNEAIRATVAAIILFGLFITYPLDTFKSVNVDNYSIYDQPRRHDLEGKITDVATKGRTISGAFEVKETNKANHISFVVEHLEDSGCTYLFKLFDSSGECVYQTNIFGRKPKKEELDVLSDTFYYDLEIPMMLYEDEYRFTIEAISQNTEDSLAFYYCWRRLDEDYNPVGNVVIDKHIYDNLEWVFAVSYE